MTNSQILVSADSKIRNGTHKLTQVTFQQACSLYSEGFDVFVGLGEPFVVSRSYAVRAPCIGHSRDSWFRGMNGSTTWFAILVEVGEDEVQSG